MLRSLLHPPAGQRPLAPKVPEITAMFWVAKLLTTGMGESMSDFLGQVNVPMAGAVGVLGVTFALRLQLRATEYRARVYWFAVMMVAIFGTMVADGVRDGAGIPYSVSTVLCALATVAVFVVWRRTEGTLSIRPGRAYAGATSRRERCSCDTMSAISASPPMVAL